MMRSLYTGVSGLSNHQTRMDVLSNNIANVNTIGFKASRTIFSDALSQTMQGATSPRNDVGGINAKQIGLGVKTSSIDILFTKTSFQTTNVNTDLAINNNGFFIVNQGNQSYYTRAGNFYFDQDGNFLTNEGLKVQGWMADSNGNVNSAAPLESIVIPVTSTMPPKISSAMDYKATNLTASANRGDVQSASVKLVDSQGYEHSTSTSFIKVADNTWVASTTIEGTEPNSVTTGNSKIVTFDSYGKYAGVEDINLNSIGNMVTPATTPPTIENVLVSTLNLDSQSAKETIINGSISFVDENGIVRSLGVKASCTEGYSAGPPASDAKWKLEIIENSRVVGSTVVESGAAINFPPLTLTDGSSYQFDGNTQVQVTNAASTQPFRIPSGAGTNTPLSFTPAGGTASPMQVNVLFDSMTQYAGSSSQAAVYTDGYPAGDLKEKNIDASGTIVGTYSNGQMLNLAQIGMAIFNNQQGLERAGSTLFTESNNSGDPIIGTAGSGGIGTLQAGSLEMANVDLAEEFTNMIVTQRGYQSNSRIITTSDELLQELMNLKR